MNKGFTLIEVLVSVILFAVFVTIAVGGFVSALHSQREVAFLIAAQSNAGTALEQMAREIRTGYLFCNDPGHNGNPGPACAYPICTITNNVWTCSELDFYDANSENVHYKLQGGSLLRSDTGSTGTFVPITADNVRITYLDFTLFGNTEGDHWNPRITIAMQVVPSSTDPALTSDILNLQTSISARTIDCPQNGSSC
ncbi:MAG TPA: prepilin-type N-terminal cleavage/methylation domain-containing protein [Candidatus Paceibacterota bacterium]|nr:prepilin-type N-terminal cleavage/methylation domain-containing protein [Candidatus Paceibacterota bacterium]